MATESYIQSIIQDLKDQSYFSRSDNSAKTRIRTELAEKYKVDAVWIKDVVINGYGKEGRRIEDSKIAEILGSDMANVRILKTSEDPAEGTVTFRESPASVFFVSSAPGQVGIGLMKIMKAITADGSIGLIIVNNGNDGPLPDNEFNEIKATFDKLGIYSAGVYNGGISHKPNKFHLVPNKKGGDAAALQLVNPFTSDIIEAGLCFQKTINQRVAAALLSKRFLILTGLSGSGKTKLAQAFSRWITPSSLHSDPFALGKMVEAEKVQYTVVHSNDHTVDFKNSSGTVLSVPRKLIAEWADCITSNGCNRDTASDLIKNKVSEQTSFGSQMHNMHSVLKAAALHLLSLFNKHIPSKCYEVVPVGADWTGNENILGYPNGLDASQYVTKQALDLIHRAEETSDIPHFLILDEMNLSHVERYFSDLLSAIESDEPLQLHHDANRLGNGRSIKPTITLPKNLFIIGTVNVDETTYMFSPKVLDRANVIEFRMAAQDVEDFLSNPKKPKLEELDGKGSAFGKPFVDASKSEADLPADIKQAYEAEMLLFFNVLQEYGSEYGYRVAHEASRFMKFYQVLGECPADGSWFNDAFDALVVQKFLPKLNGSESKLRKPLWALAHLCFGPTPRDWKSLITESFSLKDAVDAEFKRIIDKGSSTSDADSPNDLKKSGEVAIYPMSFDKVVRMWRSAQTNGFTSFAESI